MIRAIAVLLGTLLFAASASAGPLTMRGSVSARYRRDDRWFNGDHTGSTRLYWAGSMSVSGMPFRPGVLIWIARVTYRGDRTSTGDTTARSGSLTFALQTATMVHTRYPAYASASRTWSDFLSDGGGDRTGTSITTTLGVASSVRRTDTFPEVQVRLGHNRLDNTSPLGEETYVASTNLDVAGGKATKQTHYDFDYSTGWNSGTYAENNYRNHVLRVSYSTAIAGLDDGRFRIIEDYSLRDPTNDASTNPRYDRNRLSSGVTWRTDDILHNASYSYHQFILSVAGAPEGEQVFHRSTYSTQRPLSEETDLRTSADFDYGEERAGNDRVAGAANRVGATLTWSRARPGITYSASGGGSLGLSSEGNGPGGGPALAYSAQGSAGLSSYRARRSLNAHWTGAYRSDVGGIGGSTLSQRLNLGARYAAGPGESLTAAATVAAARQRTPLLGVFLSRTTQLSLSGRWYDHRGQLLAGVSEGTEDPLSNGGDGLLLPVEFNTRRYFTQISSARTLTQNLSVSGFVRSLWSKAPERESSWEHGIVLTVQYTIGLLDASVSERYSVGGAGDRWRAGNTVWVQVARRFGASF